ncbi:hypothetical protein MAP00_003288 [Monascus purpureus]|nr:hypothetical protein MAP00_003288 [Monascus purpureus]
MPDSEIRNLLVIGAQTEFIRQTKCWILGRLFRDLDAAVDSEMDQNEGPHIPALASPHKPEGLPAPSLSKKDKSGQKIWEPLRVSVWRIVQDKHHVNGLPSIDWVWVIGWITIAVQLSVSIVPWASSEDAKWQPFMITAAGTLIALIHGSLP